MEIKQEVLDALPAADPQLEVLLGPLEMHPDDDSGTPVVLIETLRRTGQLQLLECVDEAEVVTEFPFASLPARQTGFSRFVGLRPRGYALVRSPA